MNIKVAEELAEKIVEALEPVVRDEYSHAQDECSALREMGATITEIIHNRLILVEIELTGTMKMLLKQSEEECAAWERRFDLLLRRG